MMKYFNALFTMLFIAGTASAQNIDKIITKDYVDKLIKTLSSDDMQGRGTFTPGIDKAAAFIAAEFKNIGLQPLKGEANYRQTFYRYQLSKLSTDVSIEGKAVDTANVLVLSNTSETVDFNQANSDGWTKLDTAKPFKGQLRAILNSKKRQLVLVDQKFTADFNLMKSYFSKAAAVEEKDLTQSNPSASVLVLAPDTAIKEFNVSLKYKVEKMPLFNVAGMIPGKSKAKEIVIFSGHYDHLGIIKAVGQDSIANGADDDASGTTAMIALARYYKKLNNNERTLIFVAFTAEEIGGYGAKYFSRQLDPDDVMAMFNIEMIGKASKFGKNTAFITGYEKSDFGKILQKNLEGSVFTFHPDPYTEQNLFYRSDNATLAALGVPAHTISTDQIDIDKLYHSVKDEYSSLDTENILSVIRSVAISATSIIKGTDTPSRIPKLAN
jgi:Zn-dependent M28 family amino/carboxypeptidase